MFMVGPTIGTRSSQSTILTSTEVGVMMVRGEEKKLRDEKLSIARWSIVGGGYSLGSRIGGGESTDKKNRC